MSSQAAQPKKPVFGSKNTTNPFAKRQQKLSEPGLSREEPSFEPITNFTVPDVPKDTQVSKKSSSRDNDFDFHPVSKPAAIADTKPRKSSSRDSGIAEQISENYDDDFEDNIEESLPKSSGKEQDFFNQNKNFTGNLKKLGGQEDRYDKQEKDSEPSGLGLDDNYDKMDFF